MLIEIFVAPEGCPACGRAVRLVKQVAREYGADVREIHLMDAPERVAHYGIFTTPFIVIDGSVRFVGVPPEAALRHHLVADANPLT
jgi:glutaredoxin